ncbi:MAG: PIN domain-containing protein [Rhodocyclaceae bacterium]|nr:PIN domain-containing protein [Rhodocyclaceae bacterium]
MRIFLDANILFTAAHNPHGKAALVIELGRTGVWQLATSPYAAEEARRNVARKFPACLDRLETLLGDIRTVADSPLIPAPAGLAEKDAPIFRAASACRADVLLTGDIRDFGFLMNAPEKASGLLIANYLLIGL